MKEGVAVGPEEVIRVAYRDFFDRESQQDEIAYWVTAARLGTPLNAIVELIKRSAAAGDAHSQNAPKSVVEDLPAFQSPVFVSDPSSCFFYHTTDLPTFGTVKGQWDLRHRFFDYTNNFDFKGKSVLDIGAGSGFLSFAAEAAGAREVVSFDMDDSCRQDFLPFKDNLAFSSREEFSKAHNLWIKQWHNAYWLTHRLLKSRAKVYYGNVYDLPRSLGLFDVAIVGSVLEHLADPIKALASISRVTSKAMIIVTSVLETEDKVARFEGDCELPHQDYVFWTYSLGIYRHVLAMLGFKIDSAIKRSFKFEPDHEKHVRYVIVATRRA